MPVNRFTTEQGAEPTIFEMGAERKIGPELSYMAYDMNDVQPRSSREKADGSAVLYLKFTPPPDLTCLRGAESYHEKLHLDFLPFKPAEEVNHWDGVGIVGKLQRNWNIPLTVETKFGFKGQYLYHFYNNEAIKKFGGIRQKAIERYEKESKRPILLISTLGLAFWSSVHLYHRTWRQYRFWNAPRVMGLPGAWLVWMAWIWHIRDTPAAYEVIERRLDEAAEFRKILKERESSYEADWEAHKEKKGSGWWDNVPKVVSPTI